VAASTELSYWRTRPVSCVGVATVGVLVDRSSGAPIRTDIRPGAPGTSPGLLRIRLATLLVAQLFDYGTFTVMIARHGPMVEANPLVARELVAYGLPFLAVAKGALVMLVCSIVVILATRGRRRPIATRLATSVALLAVAAGLLGGISNVLVLVA
jgi:hypothetical protein